MTTLFRTGTEHDLRLKIPRLVFIIDPGHGGTWADAKKAGLKKYNVGTESQRTAKVLRAWGYQKPADGTSMRRYYAAGGKGYVSERLLAVTLGKRIAKTLQEHIRVAKTGAIMTARLTRTRDVPMTISARRKFANALVHPKLASAGKKITRKDIEKAVAPQRFQYSIFLSLHVEGSPGSPDGLFLLVRKGKTGRHQDYIDAVDKAVDERPALTTLDPVFKTDDKTAVGRLGVLSQPQVNSWSLLAEVANIANWAGYQNLASTRWQDTMADALAAGMWDFATKVYGNHSFVDDPLLIEGTEIAARRMDKAAKQLKNANSSR